MIKKILIIAIICGVLLPGFSLAQNQIIKVPETLEKAKETAGKTYQEVGGKEGIFSVFKDIGNWIKNYWENTIWPKIVGIFKKEVEPKAKEEIQKRKPAIEEEFKKEKEELKEEVPKVTKSLWEKFKELIK